VGNRTRVTVVKNKIAPPFRKVEFDILYNRGISREGELLDLGQRAGIVLKSGTWYSMKHPTDGEIRLGQGMERSRTFLMDNPDLAQVIDTTIRKFFAPAPEVDPDEEAEASEDQTAKEAAGGKAAGGDKAPAQKAAAPKAGAQKAEAKGGSAKNPAASAKASKA